MFLLRSRPPKAKARTLNAIAPLPDRQARRDLRLCLCGRLAEMAMDLTETAYTQALRDAQPPPPERAPPRLGPRPSYMPPPKAAYDQTLASTFFQEFSRCTRQAILLEARLDSGAYDNAPAFPLVAERVSRTHETSLDTPTEPRLPSDETRIHHERLEDEFLACDLDDPDNVLRTIAKNLNTAIAQTRAAGLDLCGRADASPPPRIPATTPPKLDQPEPIRAATPPVPVKPAGARPRARLGPAQPLRR